MVLRVKQEVAVGKATEMTSTQNAISASLLEATTVLAGNLAQSEPFLRYKAAEAKLNADRLAPQILANLSALQQKIRKQQQSGVVTESDLKQLRSLQSAMGANEIIQDYLLTQELAIAFLREVNQEISQLLGIDFASLTRRSSGCC